METKKILIVGAGGFGREVQWLIERINQKALTWELVGYLDDGVEPQTMINGCRVLGGIDKLREYGSEISVAIAVGSARTREKIADRIKAIGNFQFPNLVDPDVQMSGFLQIGEGNIILENTIIQPFVEIGAGNLFWHNVKIAHDDKIGSFNTFAQNTSVAGVVNIGNNCFFGNSSIILNRKNIADYTLVGAGAICKADTNPYDVIVPAKGVVLENRKSIDYI